MSDKFGETTMGRYRVLDIDHRLIAWDFVDRPYPGVGDLHWFDGVWRDFRFGVDVDLAPHQAFCRGEMPCPVYADWLEEQAVPVPPVWYDRLRGW